MVNNKEQEKNIKLHKGCSNNILFLKYYIFLVKSCKKNNKKKEVGYEGSFSLLNCQTDK